MVGSLAGCNGTSINPDSAIVLDESIETVQGLDLSAYTDSWVYNEAYGVYALENIVYCANPVDATLQSMNIYVPAAYMNEDGSSETIIESEVSAKSLLEQGAIQILSFGPGLIKSGELAFNEVISESA